MKNNPRLVKTLHHVRIHEAQFNDEPLTFYFRYVWYWISGLFKYGKKSYINIPYEREARANVYDLTYLDKRKKYGYREYREPQKGRFDR
jgi:hypothetical protein